MKNLFFLFALTFCATTRLCAQHHRPHPMPALSFQPVLNQLLTGKDLSGYRVDCSEMTIQPDAQDTVSHRHDCELFGYVLEGEVQIGLATGPPVTYKQGQMFYEKRNTRHYLTRNNLKDTPTTILLFFIIKEGRQGYIADVPTTKSKH